MTDLPASVASSDLLVDILSATLLALALLLVSTPNIKRMIRLYQGQSLLLAIIVLRLESADQQPWILFVMIPPVSLAVTVEYLLARATVPTRPAHRTDYLSTAYWSRLLQQATAIWLRQGPGHTHTLIGLTNIGLVLATYIIAFVLAYGSQQSDSNIWFGFVVALGLLVLGLFALGTQGNLLAQVMGLLVAEYGLYLAVVRIVPISLNTLIVFVVSLLLYILLTLTILLILLPNLRRASASMQVTDQRELRG